VTFRGSIRLALAAALAVVAGVQARAESVEEFYKGRNITLVIGYSVGGGYDLYARALAAHMAKHIPGNPTIVPQNMPGAGSQKVVNYLYSIAAKDGSVFGTFGRTVALEPLIAKADFDATKLTWLGSMTDESSICVSRTDSGIKDWHDLLVKEAKFGGLGPGTDPDIFTQAVNGLFGAKIQLVRGYPGTNELTLGIERGELAGVCGISYGTLVSRHADWLKDKTINLIFQAGIRKLPEIPDVPFLTDLAKTDEQRQVIKLLVAGQGMARPFAAPPDIPADRAAALRAAFAATLKDPDLLSQAATSKIEINPVSAETIQTMLNEIYATPKDIVAKAAAVMAN
jgi:tripartite-type tricarboxylate transporter receptor subunit TctC